MNRSILRFHQDAESDWVAELSCGHNRHARHNPPLSERSWVLTSTGRASRIGTEVECVLCDRGELPDGYEPYHRSAVFTEESVPKAFLDHHSTKRGVWGIIHVRHGQLRYHVHAPFDTHSLLTPAAPGVVLPEVDHHVSIDGPVEFFVEFWRRAAAHE